MAMADMVAKLGLDSSGFIAPIEEAIAKLNSLATESQASFQKLAASTAPAEAAAKNLAATQEQSSKAASQAVEKQHTSLIGFALKSTGVLSLFASGIALFDPKFKKYALGLSLISIAHKIYQATIGASAEAARKAHAAMAERPRESSALTANKSGGGLSESNKSLTSSTLELAGVMGRRAFLATLAYKAGLDEVAIATSKHLSLDSKMMQSITGIGSSLMSIGGTGFDMFAEGVKGSVLSVLEMTTGFTDLTSVVDFGAGKITQGADFIGSRLKYAADNTRELGIQVGAFLGAIQSKLSPLGNGLFQSDKYKEEGRELNKLIEETARHQAAIDAQTNAYKIIKDTEALVVKGRQLAIDKSRISSIQTVAGIDAELQAFKHKQAFLDKDILKSKDHKKYIQDVTQAIEGQRTALLAAEAKPVEIKQSEASKDYEALTQSLVKLEMGQEAYARSQIMSKDATDDEVIAMLEKFDAIVAIEAAQKEQAKADEATKKSQQETAQLFTQGANKITEMADQIDVLAKTATASEIEMRKLTRAGYGPEQLSAMGQMIAKTEELKAQNEKTELFAQGANKITEMKDQIDLLTGAATAAEIEMRKLSRSGYDEEQIAEIGRLTEQTEKLRAKAATGQGGGAGGLDKAMASQSKASFAGSSETASLFLRGVGGDSGGVQQKQLVAQQKMVTHLDTIAKQGTPASSVTTTTANFV